MIQSPNIQFKRRGILFTLSGPTAVGKNTLCSNIKQTHDFVHVITCTTRDPRLQEQHGVDYHFLTEKEFKEKIQNNEFLEYTTHNGFYYGSLKKDITNHLDEGVDILITLNIDGVRAIRNIPNLVNDLVDTFIMPPSIEELEQRLRRRNRDSEDDIQKRLAIAREEVTHWSEFCYTIVSETMEEDLSKLRAIVRAERYKSKRLRFDESENYHLAKKSQ
jgi:guanylate kinase